MISDTTASSWFDRYSLVETVERFLPVHEAQLLTYLRLAGLKRGLLLNFYMPLMKDGIKRFVL